MKNNILNSVDKKTLIIAEIGNNHEGSFVLAKKLIDKAKECGVNAVKFQTFIPSLFYSNETDKKRMMQLKKFSLSFEQFRKLSVYAKTKDLIFFSTPLDYESAKFLNKIQKIFKISSSDNNYFHLIEKIAHFDKDIIISTGLSDIKLLKTIDKIVSQIWKKNKIKKKLAFTHCVSSYPTNFKDTNLGAIKVLKKQFPSRIIGYSDHTIGIDACIVAAAFGAKIIEKHFTLDNNYSKFRDHKLSANPNEMKMLVDRIRSLDQMKNFSSKKPLNCEKDVMKTCRRYFAASSDLRKGSIIRKNDIIGLRSSKGISVSLPQKILNRKIKKNLLFREIINKTDLI